ncbi:SDR family oxidoreductase [Microbacterium sp. NPDC028030]|uniref:SDR family NAD(P)-dependent oxidoreductase n=1 Tax=Microbacterium sp. NPDC028030 TaxID=3155124 RepID=UPI0033EDF87C
MTALAGRRVLVTGGATGIGAAISAALLEAGARVVVAQRTRAELDDALTASGLGDRVDGVVSDLSEAGAAERLVDHAADILGGLDGLVNNAAITGPPAHRALLDVDDVYVDGMLAVNLGAAIRCSAAAARHMIAAGGGVIVSTASVLAHTAAPAAAVYSATKAGLLGFTRSAALELAPYGIRVLTVSPGDIDTPSSVAPPSPPDQRAVRTPAAGRRGRPEEIGAVVRFLLSVDAGYLTGIDILVDGGFLLS